MSWTLDAEGWCGQALRFPSPNFDARPEGLLPELLVIHSISLPPGEYGGMQVTDFFLNRLDGQAHPYFAALQGVRVSSHFFVQRNGTLLQFVSCASRAWHAGVSSFGDRRACNDFSIGVELEGIDTGPFADAQYTTLCSLTRLLCANYPLAYVAAHSEIAVGRKTDPGPQFDWSRYLAQAAMSLRRSPEP
jgi:AmpD protein